MCPCILCSKWALIKISKRGKDLKERKTVVYNNPPIKIYFPYLPFKTQPNHLKIADFCVSLYIISVYVSNLCGTGQVFILVYYQMGLTFASEVEAFSYLKNHSRERELYLQIFKIKVVEKVMSLISMIFFGCFLTKSLNKKRLLSYLWCGF